MLTIREVVEASVRVHGNTPQAAMAAAQAIHESALTRADGGSKLAREDNNLFGIKGSGTAGTSMRRTGEVFGGQAVTITAGFAKNNTIEDSFIQHAKLMEKPRYAGVRNAQSVEEAASALGRSGYATDPAYAAKLMKTYNTQVAPLIGDVTGAATDLTKVAPEDMANYVRDLRAYDDKSEAASKIEGLVKENKIDEAQTLAHETTKEIFKKNGVPDSMANIKVASSFGPNSAAKVIKAEDGASLESLAKEGKGGLNEESLGKFNEKAKKEGVAVADGKTLKNTTAGEAKKTSLDHGSKFMARKFPQVAAGKSGTPAERQAAAENDFGDLLKNMMGSGGIGALIIMAIMMMFGMGDQGQSQAQGQGQGAGQNAAAPATGTPAPEKPNELEESARKAGFAPGKTPIAFSGSDVPLTLGNMPLQSTPVFASLGGKMQMG